MFAFLYRVHIPRLDVVITSVMWANHCTYDFILAASFCRLNVTCLSVTLMYCAQTTESIIMRPSPDCSPAILVFPKPNMNPVARGNPTHWGGHMLGTRYSHSAVCRIRSYKRLGGMSAAAEPFFVSDVILAKWPIKCRLGVKPLLTHSHCIWCEVFEPIFWSCRWFFCWDMYKFELELTLHTFHLRQRFSSEEACSVLLPVLAAVVMWRGRKSVLCVAQCVVSRLTERRPIF